MLQNQLEDFWSDSLPIYLICHAARSLIRLLSPLLRLLSRPPPPPPAPPSFLPSLGSGLASLVLLADSLDSNRSLSLPFDPRRHSSFGPDCAVCMSQLSVGDPVRVLPCRHVYHLSCLDQCLRHHLSSCPLCKRPISPSADHHLSARFGEALLASFSPSPM